MDLIWLVLLGLAVLTFLGVIAYLLFSGKLDRR